MTKSLAHLPQADYAAVHGDIVALPAALLHAASMR